MEFLGALVVVVALGIFMLVGAGIQYKKHWPFKD